jgi:hypothetical protein
MSGEPIDSCTPPPDNIRLDQDLVAAATNNRRSKSAAPVVRAWAGLVPCRWRTRAGDGRLMPGGSRTPMMHEEKAWAL